MSTGTTAGTRAAGSSTGSSTGSGWLPSLLRATAVGIAVLGVWDPVWLMPRASRPLVSVVASDSAHDRAQLAAVRRQLSTQATVLDAPLPVAAGTVVVGERLPDGLEAVAFPAVSVPAHGDGGWVAFRRIQAPSRVHLESRITVLATVEAHGGRPQDTVIVSALSGSTVVAEVRREVTRGRAGARLTVPLTVVPWGLGVASLRIRAVMAGGVDTVRHDVTVAVDTVRTPVLFFDTRPSWRSTFERRALARDLRYAVTSRVVTATSASGVTASRVTASRVTASRVTGAAPMALASAVRTGPGGVVVIGAPEALTAADVRALEGVLRGGATVVLLPDHAAPGPVDALLGTGGWRVVTRRSPAVVHGPGVTGAPADSLRWQGQVIGVPNHLPFGAERLAWLAETGETVVWRVPVGEGMLVVSGVFDAWRTAGSPPTTPAIATTAPGVSGPSTAEVKTATAVPLPVLGPGDRLPFATDQASGRPAPRRPAFPMHAPLWLVPLLACLSAEWWLRRRRGLR